MGYRGIIGLVCVKLFKKIYGFVSSKDMWTCYECGMNKQRTREDNSLSQDVGRLSFDTVQRFLWILWKMPSYFNHMEPGDLFK